MYHSSWATMLHTHNTSLSPALSHLQWIQAKMKLSGNHAACRQRNAKALSAFDVDIDGDNPDTRYRTVREGSGASIFTIGYEGRDGEDLVTRLVDAGVEVLVDVRERPFSRKPDFRKRALQALCEESGVEYESWVRLGSTAHQRENLKATRDIGTFMKRFRDFAKRGRTEELESLGEFANKRTIALLCYERAHEECHRCVVADLVADEIDASVVAIL